MRSNITSRPASLLKNHLMDGWSTDMDRRWDPREDEILVQLYRQLGAKRLARFIPRSAHAIHTRAYALGLTNRYAWTKVEDLTVRLFYGWVDIREIAKSLGRRTVGSIYARAWRLGIAKEREEW